MNRVSPARLVVAFTAALAAAILTTAGCASRATGPEKQQQRIAKELREMSEAVPKAVADANRAALVQVAIGRLDTELAGLRAALDNFEMDLRLLNARRDASRAQLAERLDLFETERKAARSRVRTTMLTGSVSDTTSARPAVPLCCCSALNGVVRSEGRSTTKYASANAVPGGNVMARYALSPRANAA